MASPETRLREHGEAAIEGVERQQWLEPLAERLQRAVAAVFEAGGQTGRRVRDVLHGTWLGHPLHPVHTDIPLGAWTVAGILDLSGGNRRRDRAADAAISIGLAGAVGAAVTGLTDWHHTTAEDRRVGLLHGLLNLSATAPTQRRSRFGFAATARQGVESRAWASRLRLAPRIWAEISSTAGVSASTTPSTPTGMTSSRSSPSTS